MSLNLFVTNDYLISPAICLESEVVNKVQSLIGIKKHLDKELGNIFFESEALNGLIKVNLYPCKNIFDENISKFEGDMVYSGSDIAKVVNNILYKLSSGDLCVPECLAEWLDKKIEPKIRSVIYQRNGELETIVEQASLTGVITKDKYSILHYPVDEDASVINVTGKISNILPEVEEVFPIDFDDNLKVFSELLDFNIEKSGVDSFNKASSDDEIKAALIDGALRKERELGVKLERRVIFGNEFFRSLYTHQCAPNERFSGVAYDVICQIIAGAEKNSIKPFFTNSNSKKQIEKDGKLAWRTHVTKGNPALRLMFWSDGNELVLANIGNKKELVIL